MHFESSISLRKLAVTAGFSLVLMALLAGFGYGFAFPKIVIPGNPRATLENLQQSEPLFRMVILAFVLILLLDVVVAWAFYFFFKPVDAALSLLAAWLRIVYAALLGTALFPLAQVLPLLKQPRDNGPAMLNSLQSFQTTWSLGLILFGFHLLGLGYLVMKSGRAVPRMLGWLAVLAALCYLFTNTANLVFPDYEAYKARVEGVLSLPMALGELALAVWLLVKGGKRQPAVTTPSRSVA